MGYWKSKVLPKIKKVFEKNSAKKAAAAEASKSFDESKEEISKTFEEKKTELEPKVLEIYEASSVEIKGITRRSCTVVKERTEVGVKKHAAAVNKFLEELVKIEFPGAKAASEASTTFGPALVSGAVLFVFEKVAVFLPVEAPKEAAPAAEEAAVPEAAAGTAAEREVALEEEKKETPPKEEETVPAAATEAAAPAPEEPAAAVPAAAAPAEEPAKAAEPAKA